MTIDEAKQSVNELERLNFEYWFTHDKASKDIIRNKMASISKAIYDNGFKIKRCKVWSNEHNMLVPSFSIKTNKHKDDVDVIDNRPDGRNYKRDCTTRCICFCTGEDYEKIRTEQFYYATMMNRPWRNIKVWRKSLFKRGFSEIDLPHKVSRSTFLRLFKDSGIDDGVIATLSSGHIAAIDMKKKKVLDTWNSSGGRIYKIFVPDSQYNLYINKIKAILG